MNTLTPRATNQAIHPVRASIELRLPPFCLQPQRAFAIPQMQENGPAVLEELCAGTGRLGRVEGRKCARCLADPRTRARTIIGRGAGAVAS
jgi:hypothetical protein